MNKRRPFDLRHWTAQDEAEYEQRYREQQDAVRDALASRNGEPPQCSQVGGPPKDWKKWAPLLGGIPVGSCTAFDVPGGWVSVWPLVRPTSPVSGPTPRSCTANQRRLYGVVTAVPVEEYWRLKKELGQIDIWEDEDKGEEIPGTDIRTISEKRRQSWLR